MIRILDKSTYKIIGAITDYQSIIWNSKFYDYGGFEIHLSPEFNQYSLIDIYNVIYYKELYGYILKRTQTEEGISIYGYDLNGYNKNKYHYTQSGYVDIFRTSILTNCNFSSTVDTGGVPSAKNVKESFYSEELFEGSTTLKNLCENWEIGYRVKLDGTSVKTYFSCGKDKTKSVILSKNNGSISSYQYDEDYFNNIERCAYIRQTSSTIIQKSEYTPFVISTPSNCIQECDFGDDILETSIYDDDKNIMANKVYAERNIAKTIQVTPSNYYKYGTDYNLGDYITCVVDVFGQHLSQTQQIVEVQQTWDEGGESIDLTLGTKKENYIKVLNNKGVI